MPPNPSRGEIWLADLDPIRGHEQAGTLPVLVISTDSFNHGPARLVFVVPLTRRDRGIPLHVPIDPPEGGLRVRSVVLCDGLRSISKNRLHGQAWGEVTRETIAQVEDKLKVLLEL